MIKDKTVLILGAGASRPYGYPLMDDLRDDIIDNFEEHYVQYIRKHEEESVGRPADSSTTNDITNIAGDRARAFIKKFDGSKLMIDEFLAEDDNKDFRRIGKFAIVCSIVAFENESFNDRKKLKQEGDWYRSFYRQLFNALKPGQRHQLWDHKFSVVTFNYDRSFEYYIWDSLVNAFRGHTKSIEEKLNNIDIVHVYGQLLKLPWQHNKPWEKDPGYYDYKKIDSYDEIERCAKNIDIMHSSRKNSKRVIKARDLISKAKKLIFLGFGFDNFNMTTLGFPPILKTSHDIFWTQYKLDPIKVAVTNKLFLHDGKITTSRVPVDGNSNDLIIQPYLFQ